MMAMFEALKKGFDEINHTAEEAVLSKCVDLCTRYDIDPEDFLNEWLAYTVSHLDGAPPSLEALEKMERKEFQKVTYKTPKKATELNKHTSSKVVEETPPKSVSNSATTAPSLVFRSRTDSRLVECSFGDCTGKTFQDRAGDPITVIIQNEEMAKERYMYETLVEKAAVINNITKWVGDDIMTENQLKPLYKKLSTTYGEMVVCGRVFSEFPGKLHVHSLLLEGVVEQHNGEPIKLCVDNMDKYSFFSGQVVVMKGKNLITQFIPTEICYGAPLSLPVELVSIQEPLQIVVAAGPYTMSENMLYEPLEDLLKYVVEMKPNLLILMGPFVEKTPQMRNAGKTYDAFFDDIVDGIVERVKGTDTQVVLVSSERDIHNHTIFPTPPFTLSRECENVLCASNPFIIDINGLTISGSTTDILFHLNNSEITKGTYGKNSDKMTHLVSHLINQRSFYPLYPPDAEVKVDHGLLAKYGMIEELPHLMFLPSKFVNFVRNVSGCVVVNPERLCKGRKGGTFARLEVRPGEGAFADRVSCEILRI